MKDSPKLINVTEAGGNYSRRVKRNYEAWVKYYSPTVRVGKSLTDYANNLLSGKLLPLYNLVLDYTGNRTEITRKKHDLLMKVRSGHASNVEQQLREMLLSMYSDYRSIGAVRNSDRKIISKFQ